MKVNAGQIERALDAPPANIRLFLLYGPDEAGSRAQAARLERAMGPDAQRIDLDGATLKAAPARLADEAATISLFGDRQSVRIALNGEEPMAAIEMLLKAPAAGNPVVAIAGALKLSSVLLKRAIADPAIMACANYQPEGHEADTLAMAMARAAGMRMGPEVARAIVNAAGNDRAVMAQEIEKLALFLDAAPERPCDAEMAALEAIGAGEGDGQVSRLIDAVLGGEPAAVAHELAVLAEQGSEGIALIRVLNKRVQLLARLAADVAGGTSPQSAVEALGKAIFYKEKGQVLRQLKRWPAPRIATCSDRLLKTERAIKAAGSTGPILADVELIAIARAAQTRR